MPYVSSHMADSIFCFVKHVYFSTYCVPYLRFIRHCVRVLLIDKETFHSGLQASERRRRLIGPLRDS